MTITDVLLAMLVPFLMLVGMLGTVVVLLLRVGGFVSRVESAVARVTKIEERLDAIPAIQQRIIFVEEWVKRIDDRHDSTRAHAIRAEAQSGGHFGE